MLAICSESSVIDFLVNSWYTDMRSYRLTSVVLLVATPWFDMEVVVNTSALKPTVSF